MLHDIHYRTLAVVVSAAGSFVALVAENVSDPTWAQGGVAAALFAVVLYFLKRGDAREDAYRAAASAREQALQHRIDQLEAQLTQLASRRRTKDTQ